MTGKESLPKLRSSNIGLLIKYIRKSSGMTQTALSEKVGISYQQVQKYEKGVSELTLSRLKQLADALDVPVGTFIEELESSRPALTDEDMKVLALLKEVERNGLKPIALKMMEVLAAKGK